MKQRPTGQIIRKGERKYGVRIFLGRDEHGKRRTHNKTIHGTKKDAEAYKSEAMRRRDLNLPLEESRETLGSVLDKYLEGPAKQRLRQNSLRTYRETVERYIRPRLGSKLIARLTADELQEFSNYLSGRLNLGPRTINHIFMVLSGALTQAVKWKLLRENPVRLVERPKVLRKEMHAMSAEEASRFLDAAMLDPYHHLFDLMLQTGCRPSEALALKWTDIDLKARTVTIQRGIHWARDCKQWDITPPKTPKGARTIPLSESGVRLLEERKRSQLADRLKKGWRLAQSWFRLYR